MFDLHKQSNSKIIQCLQWILDMYRLGQKSDSQLESHRIFQKILEQIVLGFEADSGSLAFLCIDKEYIEIVAGIDLPAEVIGSIVPLAGSKMGTVIDSGQPMLINGNHGCQQSNGRVHSAMSWPLHCDNRVIGALNINRAQHSLSYNELDLESGGVLIDIISVVLENTRLHRDHVTQIQTLERMNHDIKVINNKLESAQNQLLQSEKMASVGQLAAGVAHEINNPVGYINSNISALEQYIGNVFLLLKGYERYEPLIDDKSALDELNGIKEQIEIDYLKQDIVDLINESQEGVNRVTQIVQDLKDFSHVDEAEWQWMDLHKGIDSTLNVAQNEIKYKADVEKFYGDIPPVNCIQSQINQVFMNLLVNAAQAIKERGVITIRSGTRNEQVWVKITDTGKGIAQVIQNRIFEPFFTTKPVGKGTGLGLALSYGIIDKHGGHIQLQSEINKGSSFTLWLPINQSEENLADNSLCVTK